MKKSFPFLIFLLSISFSAENIKQSLPTISNIFKVGNEVILRKTYNNSRRVYIDDKSSFDYLEGKFFPLLSNETVVIKNIYKEQDKTFIELENEKIGQMKIRIFYLNNITNSDNQLMKILKRLFVLNGDNFVPFYGNLESKIFHINGCNHAPVANLSKGFNSEQEAMEAGFQKCDICFNSIVYFPGYTIENYLAREVSAKVRYYYPAIIDEVKQNRIQKIGDKILNNWIFPLKGYRYSFSLVKSRMPNSIACPGGDIFITDSLYNSLESDFEIEALLAHEIAHVEFRHGYSQYILARNSAIAAALVAGFVGAMANNVNRNDVADIAYLMTLVGGKIALSGYSREYEEAADAYSLTYLKNNGYDANIIFSQVLSKLKYYTNTTGVLDDEEGIFDSHPNIDKRIFRAKNMDSKVLVNREYKHSINGHLVASIEPKLIITIKNKAESQKKILLHCMLNATEYLRNKISVPNFLSITTEKQVYRLQNTNKSVDLGANESIIIAFEINNDDFDISSQNIMSMMLYSDGTNSNFPEDGYTFTK